jgi:lipid II:glycine glycyltransferase (peptidoglycan interpeptide bridge formation enzyme)
MINSSTLRPIEQVAAMALPEAHLLQSQAWAELKSHFGWTPRRVQVEGVMAQILFRRLPLGWTVGYIPKGPAVDWRNKNQCQALFAAIHAEAKQQRAIFLKVEPHAWLPGYSPNDQPPEQVDALLTFFNDAGFMRAGAIQPQSSIMVDISGDEATILAAMKQKTRYNIRLAEKRGVTVQQGDEGDLAGFYQLSQLTAQRDGFGIHSAGYYETAYRLFSPRQCALLVAEFEGELLAALMVFYQGQEAYYFYGASSNYHRNLMAPYRLQWEAIRWAKAQGCRRYDLWGIPDTDPDTLEEEFAEHNEGLWGVYRFKRGFGGQIVKSVGAFDYVYNPIFYKLYRLWRRKE